MPYGARFFLSGAFLRSESDRKNLSDLQNTTHSFWYKQVLAPAVCFFPIWFRFAQCLRKYVDVGDGHRRWVHLWNAAKYAFSLIVTITTVVARHGEVQVEVEYLDSSVRVHFQLGLGRARGLGVKLLQGRVVGGHVVPTAFFA